MMRKLSLLAAVLFGMVAFASAQPDLSGTWVLVTLESNVMVPRGGDVSMVPGVGCQSRSGRYAVIVSQHAAEPLAARYLTGGGAHFLARLDQSVVEPLVIALCMIMA